MSSTSQMISTRQTGIRSFLADLRGRLRRYLVLHGLLLITVIVGLAFWITVGFDEAWFTLQKLEIPVPMRAAMLAVMLAGLTWLIVSRLLMPAMRRLRDRELALLAERKFPELNDRLITAVECESGYPGDGELVRGMIQRTVREADASVTRLDPGVVFSSLPLRRAGLAATAMFLSLAGLALISPGIFSRWWNAFVLCEPTYHSRTTSLEVSVIAQPNDRVMTFRAVGDMLEYRHAAGADLELEIRVPTDRRPDGGEWVIPERVRVDITKADGSRTRNYVSAVDDRVFRVISPGIDTDVSIEIRGGDFRTPQPLIVKAVQLPLLNELHLDCDFPEYTKWNVTHSRLIPVTGREIQIPAETVFRLTATASKPLERIRVVTDAWELSSDRERSHLQTHGGPAWVTADAGPLISEDGRDISVPLLVSRWLFRDAQPQDLDSGTELGPEGERTADVVSAAERNVAAAPIPSGATLRIYLEDEDEIISVTPESVRILGRRDAPPAVTVRTRGIGKAITPRATIPVTGRIRDDYGISAARFEFLLDDESNWRTRPFRSPPKNDPLEYILQRGADEEFQSFEVRSLDLRPGQTLTLSVVADGVSGPYGENSTRAEPWVLQVVSNEELLSLLYTKEIQLRRQFEQILQSVRDQQTDLNFHIEIADRLAAGSAEATAQQDQAALRAAASRVTTELQRQQTALRSLVDEFESIVEELVNNQIPPRALVDKMNEEIVDPLNVVADDAMTSAVRSAIEFRRIVRADGSAGESIRDTEARTAEVIRRLVAILDKVRDLAEFHEALRDLKTILEDQQRLMENTQSLQKKQLIDRLKILD